MRSPRRWSRGSRRAMAAADGVGELTRRASLNAFASLLEYGTRLVVGFAVNPILLVGLGSFGFGVWQVLGRIAGYMSAAGGRAPQALKWSIANRQASDDHDEKRRQVGSSLIVASLFLPILLAAGIVIAWFVPGWLDAPPDTVWPIRAAAALLALNLSLMNFLEVPRSVLEGQNLGFKRMGVSALLIVVWGGLTVLAIEAGLGLPGVATAMLLTTLISGVTYLLIVRAFVPWFGTRRPARSEVRAFLQLSGWFLAWRLVMQILRSSDVVVLGIADSAELVSVYALTRYVPESLVTLVSMMVMGVAPGLGGLIGEGRIEKSAAVRAELMSATWLLGTAAGTGILLLNRSFVGLWVGEAFFAGDLANLLIVLVVFQFVFIRNDANIIDLTLDLKKKVILGVGSGAAAVLLAVIFVAGLDAGIVGLCVGFLVGRGVLSVLYPAAVGRVLGLGLGTQLRRSIRPVVATTVLFGLAIVLGRRLDVTGWLPLVGLTALTAPIGGLLAFFGGLGAERRRTLRARAARVARSFRLPGTQ